MQLLIVGVFEYSPKKDDVVGGSAGGDKLCFRGGSRHALLLTAFPRECAAVESADVSRDGAACLSAGCPVGVCPRKKSVCVVEITCVRNAAV